MRSDDALSETENLAEHQALHHHQPWADSNNKDITRKAAQG